MKKIQYVFKIIFVMDDGAELEWKIFKRLEHYHTFIDSVTEAEMRKFGIVAIRYKLVFPD